MEYKPTIGLEIHAELKTRTKMFCDSLNESEERHPNTNVCPVCLGHPGTLPMINKKAVEAVIKTGLALHGKINPHTKFDRKNYFYPDLPKGYQISQYDKPLVHGGELNGIRIRRIHLEEDAAILVHTAQSVPSQGGPSHGSGQPASLVDFNRAGVPLMELVTEPDVKSAEAAIAFARELQLILRYLDVSDADMERGQMRIEANISISADDTMGTKVEVKNINSFKVVSSAIAYELKRQGEVLAKGEKVAHETRGWDEAKQKTVSQRSKEEAHDYRYFPEPDLPPFETSIFDPEKLKIELPELPTGKRARFAREYGLEAGAVEMLVGEPKLAEYFEEAVSELKTRLPIADYQLLYNYLTSDMRGLMNESEISWDELKIEPEHLAHLVVLVQEKKIASRQAKDTLRKMSETGLDPEEILGTEMMISDDSALEAAVKKVIGASPAAVADYKKGKAASLQFLVGKAMAELKGRGEPQKLRTLIEQALK